jgi:hypothetical protein
MSTFKSTKILPYFTDDYTQVVTEVIEYFKAQAYEVTASKNMDESWNISISKGGTFKSILGMKSSLNVQVKNFGQGTYVEAGVGIFGQQAIPTAISMFIAWPILITQIWGLVKQANLDDEAIDCIEKSLKLHATPITSNAGAPQPNATVSYQNMNSNFKFCSQCGAQLPSNCKFCSNCGARLD